tara:strand:- start:1855 stop:2343 length:489 start_codon:yes stop_codon:yes gene_type:complete
MSKVDTEVFVNKEDLGKNLYRKKTYYTLCIEQDVLAKNKDEADNLFSDNGGINHDKINKELADEKDGVETYYVDANYTDSDTTKYLGKVVYDDYDGLENAKENGDVEIDTWASEDDVINDEGKVVSAVDNAIAVGQSLKKEQEEIKLTDSPLDDLEKIVNSR